MSLLKSPIAFKQDIKQITIIGPARLYNNHPKLCTVNRDFSRKGQRGHFAPPENGFAPLNYASNGSMIKSIS